jgi:hypothetical protein
MRTLLRILALAPLVLSSVGPATSGAATIGGTPSDAVSALAGHWRCTAPDGSVTFRTYVVTDGGSAASGVATGSATTRAAGGIRSSVNVPGAGGPAVGIARTVYGRQDTVEGSSFERIVERTDKSLGVETPEGAATTGLSDASSLRFTGQAPQGQLVSEEAARGGTGPGLSSTMRAPSVATPLTLTYTVDPSGLRRIARAGTATLSDDRCTRERATVATAACTSANAPAAALHAVQPMTAPGTALQGNVQMRLVVDDRGRVVGEDVLSSSSPALTQPAIMAARESTFTAATSNCHAVAGQVVFGVQFPATQPASNNGRETNL